MHGVTIELLRPQVSNQLIKMSLAEIERAKEYFQRLVRFQNLTVKKPKKAGFGHAQFGSRTIWVPAIRNKADFMTCLHEIGHTVQPIFASDGRVSCEYDAEMFALRRGRHFGIDANFLAEYEKHAKLYVAAYLDMGFKLNKARWIELSLKVQEIAAWLGVTQNTWDNVYELPFSDKMELNSMLNEDIPFIFMWSGNPEHLISMREHERAMLEGLHSNFDLITRDLIQINEI